MTVMQYGVGEQARLWQVRETRPPQYLRIYLIDGGDVTYRDDVADFPLKKGHLYIFPAQSAYALTHNPDAPISCLWFHADVFPYIVQRPIEIDLRSHGEMAGVLDLLRAQVQYPADNCGCVQAFGLALLRLLERDGFFSQRIDASLLETDVLSPGASVADMSRCAGYTQEHFIRMFTRSYGITPYQYIVSQRMNEAISLMRRGLTMDEIASRVGYAGGKSFAGAFKRKFGIAPELYRRHFMSRA